MPRKTRKQKIRATLRKRKESTHIHITETFVKKESSEENLEAGEAPREQTMVRTEALSPEEQRTVGFFKHDLQKSLILIAVIIALEIMLYYGSMYTYLGTIIK